MIEINRGGVEGNAGSAGTSAHYEGESFRGSGIGHNKRKCAVIEKSNQCTAGVEPGPWLNERLDDLRFQDGLINVQKSVAAGNRPAMKPTKEVIDICKNNS